MSKTKKEIQNILSQGPRIDLSKKYSGASGVALIFSNSGSQLELLFIKRALNPTDRWSGQIAFPGGKRDEHDPSLLSACLREVQEEIGLNLKSAQLLGSLDDIQARKRGLLLEFYIEPFVFYVNEKPNLQLSPSEVDKAYWIPVDYLTNPAHATSFMQLPGVRFPDGEVLWGLSYMMLQNFFAKMVER